MSPPDVLELAQRAASGNLDPEVQAWLVSGMRRHLAGAGLENALGLSRAGRVRARNRALQQAAALLDNGAGPWRVALMLEAAIRRHETRIQPLLTRNPTRSLSPLDAALQRAFATGVRVPRTARNLLEIVR